jgi:hypothetical protein
MNCIHPWITSNTGDFILMFIIEFLDRENSHTKPQLSPAQQKKTKRELTFEERQKKCFLVIVGDATDGY